MTQDTRGHKHTHTQNKGRPDGSLLVGLNLKPVSVIFFAHLDVLDQSRVLLMHR